jgi:hypothetical protein
MNSPESESLPSGTSHPVTVEELQGQHDNLQYLFQAALVALILLSLGVSLFMYKQTRLLRMHLEQQRPEVSKLTVDYQKGTEPLIRNFAGALQRFAVTNRDFQPILDRYRPVLKDYLIAPASAPAPVQTNPPGQPQLPKK